MSSLEYNKRTVSNRKLNKKWCKDLTGTQIPENVTKVASLGFNFGVTIKKREIPTYNIIADIEFNINKINPESYDEMLLKIANTVNNFSKNGREQK